MQRGFTRQSHLFSLLFIYSFSKHSEPTGRPAPNLPQCFPQPSATYSFSYKTVSSRRAVIFIHFAHWCRTGDLEIMPCTQERLADWIWMHESFVFTCVPETFLCFTCLTLSIYFPHSWDENPGFPWRKILPLSDLGVWEEANLTLKIQVTKTGSQVFCWISWAEKLSAQRTWSRKTVYLLLLGPTMSWQLAWEWSPDWGKQSLEKPRNTKFWWHCFFCFS